VLTALRESLRRLTERLKRTGAGSVDAVKHIEGDFATMGEPVPPSYFNNEDDEERPKH
jgi:hypothetical protein